MGWLSIIETRAKGLGGVAWRRAVLTIDLHGARLSSRGSQWLLLGDYFVKALDTGESRRVLYGSIPAERRRHGVGCVIMVETTRAGSWEPCIR